MQEQEDIHEQIRVNDALLDLCRRKLLFAVWVYGHEVYVKRFIYSEKERIFWYQVEELICELNGWPAPEKKQPLSDLESGMYRFRKEKRA